MTTDLTGSVSFDPSTDLYTYSYAVENDGPGPITSVDLFVAPFSPSQFALLDATPPLLQIIAPTYTAPSGWTMAPAYSGGIGSGICNSPYDMCGGFYQFVDLNGSLAVGTTLTGFSFATPFAPTTDGGANDYDLYGDASTGIVAYGNVVVPDGADFAYVAPEPATWVMLAIGLAGLALVRAVRGGAGKRASGAA
jgi:PEP-CTERM motif